MVYLCFAHIPCGLRKKLATLFIHWLILTAMKYNNLAVANMQLCLCIVKHQTRAMAIRSVLPDWVTYNNDLLGFLAGESNYPSIPPPSYFTAGWTTTL